jgi:hypothetical protein
MRLTEHVALTWDRGSAYRVFVWRLWEDLGVEVKVILKWLFKKWDGTHGLDWCGSGKVQVAGACDCCDGTFWFLKMQGISWLAEELLASQEGLCSVELVGWLAGWLAGWVGRLSQWHNKMCSWNGKDFDFPCVPRSRVYVSHICSLAHVSSIHRQEKFMFGRALAAVRRCVPRYCCLDMRLAGSKFGRHVFISILEYVGKVDNFHSFDPVNRFRDVGTVDSTGASVRKFCYSTENIPEYIWLSRCLKLIINETGFEGVDRIRLAHGCIREYDHFTTTRFLNTYPAYVENRVSS